MLNFQQLSKLTDWAQERAKNGTLLILPVAYKCTDGMSFLYPGDDGYPNDPHDVDKPRETGISLEQFRSQAKLLHRAEFASPHQGTTFVNFPLPDGHINPLKFDKIKV